MMPATRLAVVALATTACSDLPTDVDVQSVTLSETSLVLALGNTTALTATAIDANGQVVVDPDFRWSTNGPAIALVGQRTGVVAAVGAGATTIAVELDGQSAEAQISVTADLKSIESGAFHTCGTTALGRLACWGSNASGKLGTGTLFANRTPALVTGMTTQARDASAGGNFSCALDTGGSAYCWGSNSRGQLGIGSAGQPHASAVPVTGTLAFESITTGDHHACALTAAGEAYCWGGGGWGQLGVGPPATVCGPEPCELQPRRIDNITFEHIIAGFQHTCGVVVGGDAYCWGINVAGTLGDSTSQSSDTPVLVSGGHSFESIAAADDHTCAITVNGSAFCWGASQDGQLGDGTESLKRYPVRVLGGHVFTAISVGGTHSCGLTTIGEMFCWGRNIEGELGTGTRDNSTSPVPAGTPVRFVSVSAGATHTCGMSTTGDAYCWGWNITGQLGVGTGRDRLLPAMVAGQ